MSHPTVSVVIPTYNRSALVVRALESVMRQSVTPSEIIVVDDGSTDGTVEGLKVFGDRIQVIRQKNGGPSSARNRGIASSSGEILMFLDSDDSWLPTKIERQLAVLQAAGPEVPCCICNSAVVQDGVVTGNTFAIAGIWPEFEEGLWTNPLDVLTTRFLLFNQAVAIRRDALRQAGAFNEAYGYMEDFDLALRLALQGDWAYVATPLVLWNLGSNESLTKKAVADEIRCCEITLEIRRSIVKSAEGRCSTRQQRNLTREMRRTGRILRAMRMCAGPGIVRVAGTALKDYELLRKRIFTHMPWYPAMRTQPLAAGGSGTGASVANDAATFPVGSGGGAACR